MELAFVAGARLNALRVRRRPTLGRRRGRGAAVRFGHVPRCVATGRSPSSGKEERRSATKEAEARRDAEGNVTHFYRLVPVENGLTEKVGQFLGKYDVIVEREDCYNVALAGDLTAEENERLRWLLSETFEPENLQPGSSFAESDRVIEVGPRLNFQTAWSSNAVSICNACALSKVVRMERSRRYRLSGGAATWDSDTIREFAAVVHDRMVEQVYSAPLDSFDSGLNPEATRTISVLQDGKRALEEVNAAEGLGFDEWDMDYYLKLFTGLGRDPTNVELFDLAQSNSEHSRHWFFRGKLIIDGEEVDKDLFDIVRDTLRANRNNSVIAFADNSSTIRGFTTPWLQPQKPGRPSEYKVVDKDMDVLFTAETHNFPSGVAPFPGAETGSGGRIRDTAATGTGSLTIAGTAGYSVGNLRIPNYELPWEDESFRYPANLASPLRIAIEASNGASDYGNKFGEPVINGFARSYGIRTPSGERREYVKPIMFSGGMGQMDHRHAKKGVADVGMYVVKIGGPAYRIGMGGGAASSMVQGENRDDLDFNAVQRGDAEMEQKAYRVLRHCVEMGADNPIVAIHDQGAGGNCNVVKELIYPSGGTINLREIYVGDQSLSALEIWGAEYQEQFGLLLRPESLDAFRQLCARENVVCTVLGQADGSGKIVLYDAKDDKNIVDLDLEAVLGDLPQKTFKSDRVKETFHPFAMAEGETVSSALDRVLRLMTVCSKRFLTTKVDRSVTGLVAQQQCVGPLQLPLSDYAVTAQSILSHTGAATSIGEKPNLTQLSPGAMARMTVGEMITNLAGVNITALSDIKCEGNWMWAAKLPGEGAALYDAAVAMRDTMVELGIAVDGGKDSLSMAALCPRSDGSFETVKAPGTLVVTGYATVEDVRSKVTPDLKRPGETKVLLLDIAQGKRRLGGSALAQVYGELGSGCPDVEDVGVLKSAFETVQAHVAEGIILASHDVSDGGFLVALLEMAFAGNCGIDVKVDSSHMKVGTMEALFSEELGILVEIHRSDVGSIVDAFESAGVPCEVVAETRPDHRVVVRDSNNVVLDADTRELRDTWEATSFELDRLQANPSCVDQEREGLYGRTGMQFEVSFAPQETEPAKLTAPNKPRVAIVRQEGSNGDREMASAFHLAGFSVHDVAMSDIAEGRASLSDFRGVAFVGGFSYADVLDSAKGWAGTIRYRRELREQFSAFFARPDTFSLGVCNGCQLLALLGDIPFEEGELRGEQQPRFVHNESGRYESRFATVRLEESPSIMLKGMAGSRIGVWVSHGEGRAYFPDAGVLQKTKELGLIALTYVDEAGAATQKYPFNPNGSQDAVAGLCSADGRHLAVMPHPERAIRKWQWGYMPADLDAELETSPWLRMFQNAREWCEQS
mmetsp:Transcript_9220/g.27754  ORF Transcript_9220/g.27754 Transcript_9220/m.27754 type:complete len:1375 (-) Transcript_9220:489-4613(-)